MITWDLEGLVVALLNSTAIAGAVSWFAKKRFEAKMKEELEEKKHTLKLEEARQKSLLAEAQDRKDRVRQEIRRWQNPIYDAVVTLQNRLKNILQEGGYLALSSASDAQVNPEWSIRYDYFMPTTLFLFGQYFCWVQLLRERVSFEMFSSGSAKDAFFKRIEEVSASLSSFPPKRECAGGGDLQVFRLQQRTLGEALVVSGRDGEPRCMRCHTFLQRLRAGELGDAVTPLSKFLESVSPDTKCRWQRLEDAHEALQQLREECERAFDWETPGTLPPPGG